MLEQKPRIRSKKAGIRLIILGLAGFTTPLVSRLLSGMEGSLPWLVDLAAHWQGLYLLLLLIGVLIASIKDSRFIAFLLLTPIPWLTASEAAPEGVSGTDTITVASANVNFQNPDISSLMVWLTETNPDVVVLQEVTHQHAQQLQQLSDYPFHQVNPDNSPFGIAVLSKLPFLGVTVNWNWRGSSLKIPTLEVITQWSNQPIRIIAFHPMPPLSAEHHHSRNKKLAELVEENPLPTIIAGDFNATPWSSALTQLSYKRATGLNSTWPFQYLGIPVDQVLVSNHWAVQNSQTGPDIDSDHLPTLTRLEQAITTPQ